MALQDTSIIVRNTKILSTDIDDEVVLMHINNGRYYGLDAISGHIWNELETPTLVSELIAKMTELYQGDPDRIRDDILRLLEKLLLNKLIEIQS